MRENIREFYDRTAETWKLKVWAKSEEFNARIVGFADLSGDEHALDVGVGSGELESFLRLKHVYGIDLSKRMANECKRIHPEIGLIVGDAERLPFNDHSFDLVLCRNLLQHFDEPSIPFVEMYRVLKPGGKMLVIESAVYDSERQYVTDIVRVVESYHPFFPSHELLRSLFDNMKMRNVVQSVEGLRRKWLSAWSKSKQATEEQRETIFEICEKLPEHYKHSYGMVFYSSEQEIEQTLTFSFLKGEK